MKLNAAVKKHKSFLFIFFILITLLSRADEGMWLPQLLEQLNEKRMKSLGMKISAKDIYSVNKGSLKDAVVSFGGFCTGEVISDKGLVLTNHHCGFDAIQNHSTLAHNFIRDGFWARNYAEELSNPGLFVTFIVKIEEVTDVVLKNINSSVLGEERKKLVDANIELLKSSYKKEPYQELLIKGFFEENKYYLFLTEKYTDVRLVGAPPSAIGNFGKDTDNWMWPRHTGDFSLFRIYAGKDNRPAAYSPQNVPYKPKKALAISLNGLKQNDFTMVFGFPGRTTEYIPAEAVRQIAQMNDPAKIMVRTKALAIMDRYMRSDEAIKIQYASKYAKVSNAWKKWQGEVLGLTKTRAVEKKEKYEAEFLSKLNSNPALQSQYGDVLPALREALKAIEPYALARDYYTELTGKIDLFTIISQLETLKADQPKKSAEQYRKSLVEQLGKMPDFYRELNVGVDKEMFIAMMQVYFEYQDPQHIAPLAKKELEKYGNDYHQWAEDIYAKTKFTSNTITEMLMNRPEEVFALLEKDEAAIFFKNIAVFYNEQIKAKLDPLQAKIDLLQRTYMKAQMEVFKNKTFYPDANSTMRVTFGKVDGYQPADGIQYDYYSYLDGVMEKYVPGDYEFDVPQKLRELYKNKDFGRYARNGKMPVCFIASNHTTGGNSGSPALDAYGNLVGLNFDRVWEGTMSDINYDASICRNIMVDIRYVLFIIDKFAGAGHLVKEMKLVSAKK